VEIEAERFLQTPIPGLVEATLRALELDFSTVTGWQDAAEAGEWAQQHIDVAKCYRAQAAELKRAKEAGTYVESDGARAWREMTESYPPPWLVPYAEAQLASARTRDDALLSSLSDRPAPVAESNGWRLCQRLVDHAVALGELHQRRELFGRRIRVQ